VIDPGQTEPDEADPGATSYVFDRMGGDDFPRSFRAISVSARRDEDLLAALARMDLSRTFQA
jgi:hypothetical protein